MGGNDSAGRIPKHAYLTISTVLFALASIFVVARTTLRLRYQKKLFVDDAFLFFAEICLCASFGLLFAFVNATYLDEALLTHSDVAEIPQDFLHQLLQFHALSDAYLVLTYTSIFAVKASFLFLFRVLVRRVHKMVVFWWIALATTTVAWMVCVIAQFLPCLYFDVRATACGANAQFPKTVGISAMSIILDMITDIMIILIPIQLLWNVHIKPRQKFILGTTLCLSIFMIIIAIIRISGIRIAKDSTDIVWELFWQMIEACIAVIMVSLSVFRSFFVESNSRPNPEQNKAYYRNKRNYNGRKKWTDMDAEETETLPRIPRAMLTGMRTFLRREQGLGQNVMYSEVSDEGKDHINRHSEGILARTQVDNFVSHESDKV